MSLPFTLKWIAGWHDVTHELDSPDAPWTFARPDGLGAFQFSIATYDSGPVPDPSPEVLLTMLREFAASHDLTGESDIVTEDGALRLAASSFRLADSFVRAWYISDGRSCARVTYTCAGEASPSELRDCEQMVRTLRFTDQTHVA